MEKEKRRERMMMNEKIRYEEQERDRINHKVIQGATLTEEEQNFLMQLKGDSKAEKLMQKQKEHIEHINKQKSEVKIDALKRNKTKSNLSHSNTIKSNVISKSGVNYNDSSYITGEGTTINKQTTYAQSQINGTQLDTTMKMLGD